MKPYSIQHLKVSNFRGLRSLELDTPNPVVLVTGENAQGKTSLRMALSEILTGRCFNAAGKQVANADLVTQGCDLASIDCVLRVGPEPDAELVILQLNVERKKGGSAEKTFVILDGQGAPRFPLQTTAAGLRESLYELLGVSARALDLGLNADVYLDGTQDFDGPLTELLIGGVKVQQVLDQFEDEQREFVAQFAARCGLKLDRVTDLAPLGEAAYKERTAANRRVKELTAQLPKVAPKAPTDVDLDALRAELQKSETARDTLNQRIGAARAAAQRTVEPERDYEGEIERLAIQLDSAEAALAAQTTEVTNLAGKYAKVAAQTEGVPEKPDDASALEAARRMAYRDQQTAEQTLASVKAGKCPCGGACPKCDGTIQKKDIPASVKEVEDRIAAAKRKVKGLSDLQTLLARGLDAEANLRTMEDNVKASKDRLAEVQKDQAKPQSAPPEAEDVEPLETELAQLLDYIARGQNVIRDTEAVAEYATLKKQAEDAEVWANRVDWCVRQFRDGQAYDPLIEAAAIKFLKACEPLLAGFGLQLRATASGGKVALDVERHDTDIALPWAEASKAERGLAALAVALTFAPQGIAILDDVDGLDGKNRRALLPAVNGRPAGTLLCIGAFPSADAPDLEALAEELAPVDLVWMSKGIGEHWGFGE